LAAVFPPLGWGVQCANSLQRAQLVGPVRISFFLRTGFGRCLSLLPLIRRSLGAVVVTESH
jgi:hypothetical protein